MFAADAPIAAVIAGIVTGELSVDAELAEWLREAEVGGNVELVAAVIAVAEASDVVAMIIAGDTAAAAVADSIVAIVAVGAVVSDALAVDVEISVVDVTADVDDDAAVVGTACTGAKIFTGIEMHISALVCSYEILGGSITAEDDEFKSPINAFSTTTEEARFVITIGLRHLIEGGADLVDGEVFRGSLIALFSRWRFSFFSSSALPPLTSVVGTPGRARLK